MATVEFFINTDNAGAGRGFTRASSGNYWAVSFDSGSEEPVVDTDTLTFSGGASGTLRKIILGPGSWVGGTQEGIFIIEAASPTIGDGETIGISGGTADIATTDTATANTLWSGTNADAGAFSGLLDMVSKLDDYTDTGSDDLEVYASGTTADALGATDGNITGITCNSLLFQGDTGSADGVTAYGGDGWNTGYDPEISSSFYRATRSSGFNYAVRVNMDNVTVRGIQAEAGTQSHAFGITGATADNVIIEGCRGKSAVTNGPVLWWTVATTSANAIVRNNALIHAGATAADDGCIQINGLTNGPYIVNNWLRNNGTGRGIEDAHTTTHPRIANNVFDNTNADEIRNSSATISQQDDNATTQAAMQTKLATGAILNVDTTNDYVSATDIRPRSGGDIAGAAGTYSPAGFDLVGNSRSDSNVGPLADVFSAAGAIPLPRPGFSQPDLRR